MRILPCLLLAWSVISTDVQAQTMKESQDAAVAAIRKLGGNVRFDEKSPGKPLVSVDLSDTKVSDAGLVHLKGLTKLQSLSLISTKVTDAGLVHLKGLTKLQSLNLSFSKVTDAGVKDLQTALPKCKIQK